MHYRNWVFNIEVFFLPRNCEIQLLINLDHEINTWASQSIFIDLKIQKETSEFYLSVFTEKNLNDIMVYYKGSLCFFFTVVYFVFLHINTCKGRSS